MSPRWPTARRRLRKAAEVALSLTLPRGLPFAARRGEVVGLAGLGGHGQTEMLLALFDHHSPNWLPRRDPEVAFVAGDRRENGMFELWSILRNMTIAALPDLSRARFVRDGAEVRRGRRLEEPDRASARRTWTTRSCRCRAAISKRCCLPARLSTRAPVVLMDDPMRGVDVGTKQEVYRMIRAEADAGRTFVWYSTEMEEMSLCDRVYVFREGAIVAELVGEAITEQAILAASFAGSCMKLSTDTLRLIVPVLSLVVLLAGVFYLQPRAMSYTGLNLLFNLAVPIALATIAQMLIMAVNDLDLSMGTFVSFVACVTATYLHDTPLLGRADPAGGGRRSMR